MYNTCRKHGHSDTEIIEVFNFNFYNIQSRKQHPCCSRYRTLLEYGISWLRAPVKQHPCCSRYRTLLEYGISWLRAPVKQHPCCSRYRTLLEYGISWFRAPVKQHPCCSRYRTLLEYILVTSSPGAWYILVTSSGQTKYYYIGIYCFSSKNAVLMNKSIEWLAQNPDNVSEWSDMSTGGCLLYNELAL